MLMGYPLSNIAIYIYIVVFHLHNIGSVTLQL